MKARAVIGSNYGDEGKGLITDYLSHKYESDIVVRSNGGAQAGHTVETPTGDRHVFSHFSSGFFNGATTYLSKYFVANPFLFWKEYDILSKFGLNIKLIFDPRCMITTPYDMLINQMIEDRRGENKHGSCGVGFGETIQRNLNPEYSLYYWQIKGLMSLSEILEIIRKDYFPKRCEQLGMNPTEKELDILNSEIVMKKFIDSCQNMREMCGQGIERISHLYQNIIFEGAQGLLLDQDHGQFPHVTRSNTGIKNILDICEENKIDELDVTYVTRCYLTRHGAGPMEQEILEGQPIYWNVEDKTNIPNKYQGTLRFAQLNITTLKESIEKDLKYGENKNINISSGLAVTCIDQLDDYFDKEAVGNYINNYVGLKNKLIESWGPTRSTILEK